MHPEKMKPKKRLRGGVHVSDEKHTREMPAKRLPAPETVTLPMRQHIGAPCVPTVKVGDTVKLGQVVGDSDAFVSAPVHATVSGKVAAVKEVKLASGLVSQAVVLENDGENTPADFAPPKIDTLDDFLAAVRASGLVGLGGAGFPTHAKLRVPADKRLDTLIINAAECEPYITVDYRECLDNSWDVLGGVHLLMEMLHPERVVIAVEDNKPEAVEVLLRIAEKDDRGNRIRVMPLRSRYPQGAEKMMVLAATGRKVPPGGLPIDVGCIVMNVASAAFLARYCKTGKPLVSRSLTVDGSAVTAPQNVRVPVGTEIDYIFKACGGFREEPVKIVAGGPMMGQAIVDTHHPVLKCNNALLAFTAADLSVKAETDCIHCGRCAKACPLSLMPTVIHRYALQRDGAALKRAGAAVCMECGSCAYSCPAGKPLVQFMRHAKAVLKEEEGKQ